MSFLQRALRSFLWRSGLGRSTAQKYWKVKGSGAGMRYLYFREAAVIPDLPIAFEEAVFNRFVRRDLGKWEIQQQAEYVLEVDNVLIEPERCLGTTGANVLVEQTVVFTADHQYPYILPHLLNRRRARRIPAAVLYDGSATRNLYHHLVETVCRLSMLQRVGLPPDIPVIVNRFVYDNPFFQYLLGRSPQFSAYNWLVLEKNEWLRVEKLYRPKALYFAKESWDFTREMYQLEPVVPTRRVFLSRDKKRFTRGLCNEEAVYAMLRRYGFEIAYAEHLSMEEQIRLFQETEYLVALTGMGLVQQFFMCYEKAHIIEIVPVNRLMPEYYCQGFSLGMKYYDVVLGEDVDGVPLSEEAHKRYEGLKEYEVNVEKLERAVTRMLNAPAGRRVYGTAELPFEDRSLTTDASAADRASFQS